MMLNILNQLPTPILVCGILGIILCCFDPVRSVVVALYRWLCWLLHFPLDVFRRFLRWFNWEKASMFILAGSLIMVMALTVFIPTEPPNHSCTNACSEHCTETETDTSIYEGLRVAFSVLEGDSADFRDHLIGSPCAAGGGFWAWILVALAYALPIIVPISALGTAVTLLWNHLPHHVPIFSRNWYVFSELNSNSIRMAHSINEGLKKAKDTGVFIFLRTRRGGQAPEVLDDIRKLNYYLFPKNEARFLRWPQRRLRRLRFFFLSEQTDENFERMQDFLNAVEERWLFLPIGTPKNDVFQQELYLLSETESAPMLIEHLRTMLCKKNTVTNAAGKPVVKEDRLHMFRNTELRLLDRFRATSYDLLRTKPLLEHIHQNKLNVLVLGFGKIGREFFRTACSLGILPNCTTEFTLCDQQIGSKLNLFLTQCPELHKSVTIHPRKLNVDTVALDQLVRAKDYHYILVALGDDERNIRIASRLKRFYRLRHWNHEARKQAGLPCAPDIQPQICVNIEDSIKHDYTKKLWSEASQRVNARDWDKGLHIFGGLDQVFTPKVLMPRRLWTAARFIHRELNSMKPDEHLNWGEYERRSSLACAVRAEYLTASNSTATPAKLADTEHLRWMAYVRSEGLRYADTNLVDVYYDRDNGRHVDILGKLTPCLTEDQDKLNSVWTHLSTGKYTNDYKDKRSFRQRDLYLVEHSHEIAKILKV